MSIKNEKNNQKKESIVKAPKKTSEAFSPDEKMFLLCSPLGGYSLLDDKKYHISFMKSSRETTKYPLAVNWLKLNNMLASIADSGANALREFPWWSEYHVDTAALVPFAFLPGRGKYDLFSIRSNHYFQNQRKIARLPRGAGDLYAELPLEFASTIRSHCKK